MTTAKPAHPPLHPVQSSNIDAIGWHDGKLRVRFKGGGLYDYEAVPESVHDAFRASDSAGKFFFANIRGKFKHREVEAP